MSTKVYVATLELDGLTALIAGLRTECLFAILERPDKVDFPGASEPILAADWPVGRLFGGAVELVWEREGTIYQVRLTCAGGRTPPLGFNEVLTIADQEPELTWYYMWGEDEMAVGGRVNYSQAMPGQGRGQLGVAEYRDEEHRLVFYRYFGLKRETDHG